MPAPRGFTLLCPNIEAAQPLHQLPCDLPGGRMATASIGIDKLAEQGGSGSSQRHFEMQRQGIVIDSEHGSNQNKIETFRQP